MSRFAFDSRENHLKVSSTGTTEVSVGSFAASEIDVLATHSLGYHPNVRVYADYNDDGDYWPVTPHYFGTALPDEIQSSVYTTTTQLVMSSNSFVSPSTFDVFYRIYKDGDTNNNLSFSSFERTERVLGRFTGTFTAGASGATTNTQAHGLGEACFSVMRWRDDGGEWHDMDEILWNAGKTGAILAIPHCDGTNLSVTAYNSYATTRSIEYEVFLFKIENDDGILLDSRESTFTNFEENKTTITLTGGLTGGVISTFTGIITHAEDETLGLLYLNKSDDSTKEWKLPLDEPDLNVITDGAPALAVIRTEHTANALTIYVDVRVSGSSPTITSVDWTFRYALFTA